MRIAGALTGDESVKEPQAAEFSKPRRSEARLGELEFSDWYDTPVFETTSEERLEELASSGRAPVRLMARVVLGAEARRSGWHLPAAAASQSRGPEGLTVGVGSSWRQRASDLLDRWAAKEVSAAARLDRMLMPPSMSWPHLYRKDRGPAGG